jgi:probable O-glycosylation ligase (exosortase A-associated)
MRDLAFFLFFVVMLGFVLKKPFIGISLWAWTSFIVPGYLLYGFASGIRYNLISVAVTAFSYFISKDKGKIILDGLATLVLIAFVHTSISTIFAEYDSSQLFLEWEKSLRAIILFVFILLIIRQKNHLVLLAWSLMLSIGYFGFVEGLKFIASAGGHKISGPGSNVLGDNNHLALALNMVLPIMFFIYKQSEKALFKNMALLFMFTTALAIIGTYSRGGAIGLLILVSYFGIKSKQRIKFAIAISFIFVVVLSLAPSEWFERVDTIGAASEDNSFLGRVIAWKQSTLIALDNPFLGGGLHAVQTNELWNYYGQQFESLDFIIATPHALDITYKAAHSIYFQVLGDLGFVGLFFYVWALFLAIRKTQKISAQDLPKEDEWLKDLAEMLKLSIIIFSTCGALLSLAYFELFYILLGMIIVTNKLAVDANEKLIIRESNG